MQNKTYTNEVKLAAVQSYLQGDDNLMEHWQTNTESKRALSFKSAQPNVVSRWRGVDKVGVLGK
jgi:transposase-like protein